MTAVYDGFAPFYDLEYGHKEDDLEFYLDVAQQIGSPILEIGAGSGRISLPLVQEGHTVYGIDNSAEMLSLAEQKRSQLSPDLQKRAHFSVQDMTEFELPLKFPLCIMPFRVFLHNLSTGDQIATLDCIYEHLEPDGILAFDLFVPLYNMLARSEWSETYTPDELAGDHDDLTVTSHVVHDPAKQLLTINNRYRQNRENFERQMQYRYIFRYEMEHLLSMCGFAVEQVYGGFEGQPYDYSSGLMIFTASKQED